METDREDEALKVLRKLHYNGSNEEYIQREYHEIKTTIAAEKAITVPGWGIMFTVPQWRTRLMHGVAVQVFTQFTGISTSPHACPRRITNFPRCHWLLPNQHVQSLGNRRKQEFARRRNLQLHGTSREYVTSTHIPPRIKLTYSPDLIFIVFMIDRVGRRKPLLWGTVGITIALICEAIVNSQIDTENPQSSLSIAGVFFLFCVTVIFSCELQTSMLIDAI